MLNSAMLFECSSYRDFLNDELSRRTKVHARYSQRAFARDLGLSPGELSEVLGGRRPLSAKAAMKIAASLHLNPAETRHLLFLVQLEKNRGTETEALLTDPDLENLQLSQDRFSVVADWYCFAILNLAEVEGFSWNENWIAKRLGISVSSVRVAIRRLQRVGLLVRRNGKLVVDGEFVLSPEGIPSRAVRTYHQQMLKLALRALEVQSVEERHFEGVGIALDPEKLPALKREVSEFMDRVVKKYASGRRRREVYHMESCLFRLTQKEQSDA